MTLETPPVKADQSLLDLHEKMEHQATLKDRWAIAERFFQDQGIDLPIYMYLDPKEPGNHPMVFSAMPNWWADYYLTEDLAARDPFFKTCATLKPTLTGADFLQDNASMLSGSEQVFIQEATDTGLRTGVSCIVRRLGPGAFGGWNLGSSLKGEEFGRMLADKQPVLQMAGLVIHQYFQELAPSRQTLLSSRPLLSPRERECLIWLAKGKRVAEIAFRMGIAKVTVDLHLKQARTKLGAATREEALAKALTSRVIEL
jgi:DNA-binding CsgD family transcriptional regulator